VKELRTCLEDYAVPMLRALAYSHGIKSRNESKAELIDRLINHILQPDIVAMNLAILPSEERAALDRVVSAGGKIALHSMMREFGGVRRLGVGRLEQVKPWLTPETPTERLYYLGYLYLGYSAIGDYLGPVFFIPPELLALLPDVSSPPVRFEVKTLDQPPANPKPADNMAVYDIFVLLSAIQRYRAGGQEGPSDQTMFHLPPDMLAYLQRRMSVPPEPEQPNAEGNRRLQFFLRLIDQVGLVAEARGSKLRLDPDATRSWLEQPPTQRDLVLQSAWRSDPHWNELWHVPTLRPEDTGWQNNPRRARKHLLDHLARCPAGQWLSFSSFVRAVKTVDPDFQRPDGDYESWYIREAETGRYLRGFESWDLVEGALIAYTLTYPARWLGMIDVAFAAEDEHGTIPAAFRVTAAGAAFLKDQPGTESLPQKSPPPFSVHSDLTVEVPADSNWWERLHLERVATLLELRADFSARYRLSGDQLIGQLERGADLERIIHFLQRAAGGELPTDVAGQLRTWAKRFGQVTLGQHFVLQATSPEVLRKLQQIPEVARCFAKVVGPTTVLIHAQAQQTVVDALRKAGHIPKIEGDVTAQAALPEQ